jgi:RNA polymerase sigma-70 factor (ECF subfamily)
MGDLTSSIRTSLQRPAAFVEVFDSEFKPLVRRLALRVYDPEVAVDIAAETMAEAYLSRAKFRGVTDRELVGWINAIAHKKLARFYRHAATERRALDKLGLQPPTLEIEQHREIMSGLDSGPVYEALTAHLKRLSADQRQALELRIVDEQPYSAVAERLGITEEAARARVARALASLRKALSHHYEEIYT